MKLSRRDLFRRTRDVAVGGAAATVLGPVNAEEKPVEIKTNDLGGFWIEVATTAAVTPQKVWVANGGDMSGWE